MCPFTGKTKVRRRRDNSCGGLKQGKEGGENRQEEGLFPKRTKGYIWKYAKEQGREAAGQARKKAKTGMWSTQNKKKSETTNLL